MKQYDPKTQSKNQFVFTNASSPPKEVNATNHSTRHFHYIRKYFMLEVRKMLSFPKYSVGFTIFDVTTQLKKTLYHTLEDVFKNQDEKLAHFKPCKQDTTQLVTGIQNCWGFFDLYRQRI